MVLILYLQPGLADDHDPRWDALFGDYGRTSKTAQEIAQGCSGKRRESPNVSPGADQQLCLWSVSLEQKIYSGGTGGRMRWSFIKAPV